jgi:GTP-binding protein EngB required for normal cell division
MTASSSSGSSNTPQNERRKPMSNEDRILAVLEKHGSILETLVTKVDKLEQGQAKLEQVQVAMQADISVIKEDITAIKEDVEIIKEEAEITRSGTNRLIDWAERAEKNVRVPLINFN